MTKMNHLIIGVDPGKSGGVAFYSQSIPANAIKMPATRKGIYDFFFNVKEKAQTRNETLLLFIEKVQMFHSDSDEGGKSFGIMKLLSNFECLLTVFEVLEIPFVLVPSQTWQKELGFKRVKGEKKSERKIKYRDTASLYFPQLKPNLQTADALCLLIFGKKKLKLSPEWVNERINQTESDLFNQKE